MSIHSKTVMPHNVCFGRPTLDGHHETYFFYRPTDSQGKPDTRWEDEQIGRQSGKTEVEKSGYFFAYRETLHLAVTMAFIAKVPINITMMKVSAEEFTLENFEQWLRGIGVK